MALDDATRAEIEKRAREMNLTLTRDHWEALEAVLAYHREMGMTPTIRFLYRRIGKAKALDLFPTGMRMVAALTGLEVPEGC